MNIDKDLIKDNNISEHGSSHSTDINKELGRDNKAFVHSDINKDNIHPITQSHRNEFKQRQDDSKVDNINNEKTDTDSNTNIPTREQHLDQ